MKQPSVDIKDMLEADTALALTYKTDLFINFEPDSPDNCVTVYAFNEGIPLANLDINNKKIFYPKVQVRVRNNSSTTGWNLAKDIRDSLNDRFDESWNEAHYIGLFATSGPIPLGKDENNRFLYTVNFDVQREN